jgi:LacI family transcriptional regulator
VTGWDDNPDAARADPPLTTVRQSLRDHGRVCAELAAGGIAAGAAAGLRLQPWELVVRDSTGPPPPA